MVQSSSHFAAKIRPGSNELHHQWVSRQYLGHTQENPRCTYHPSAACPGTTRTPCFGSRPALSAPKTSHNQSSVLITQSQFPYTSTPVTSTSYWWPAPVPRATRTPSWYLNTITHEPLDPGYRWHPSHDVEHTRVHSRPPYTLSLPRYHYLVPRLAEPHTQYLAPHQAPSMVPDGLFPIPSLPASDGLRLICLSCLVTSTPAPGNCQTLTLAWY